jgi:hypothetical protein
LYFNFLCPSIIVGHIPLRPLVFVMFSSEALLDLVSEVGLKLNQSVRDLELYVQILSNNWYYTIDSIAESSPRTLEKLGMHERFADVLVSLASSGEATEFGAEGSAYEWTFKAKVAKSGYDAKRHFGLKGAVSGYRGCNIAFIREHTGARVRIMNASATHIETAISAKSQESLDGGVDAVTKLIHAWYLEQESKALLVLGAAKRVNRSADDVAPYLKTLADHWYSTSADIAEAKAEDLSNLNMPMCFAQELVALAHVACSCEQAVTVKDTMKDKKRVIGQKAGTVMVKGKLKDQNIGQKAGTVMVKGKLKDQKRVIGLRT